MSYTSSSMMDRVIASAIDTKIVRHLSQPTSDLFDTQVNWPILADVVFYEGSKKQYTYACHEVPRVGQDGFVKVGQGSNLELKQVQIVKVHDKTESLKLLISHLRQGIKTKWILGFAHDFAEGDLVISNLAEALGKIESSVVESLVDRVLNANVN